MYNVGKSLIVAGLFVAASAQAADKTAATKGFAAKAIETVSSATGTVTGAVGGAVKAVTGAIGGATKFVTGNASDLCKYLANAGFSQTEIDQFKTETLLGHNKRFYFVQGGKVVAVAISAYALYSAYNKLFGETTKQVATTEEEDLEIPYYYVSTDVVAAQAAEKTAVVEVAAPAQVCAPEVTTEEVVTITPRVCEEETCIITEETPVERVAPVMAEEIATEVPATEEYVYFLAE